jgi:outer membrane protein W
MRCAGVFAIVFLGLGIAVLPRRALADDWANELSQGRIEIRVREVYFYASNPVTYNEGSSASFPLRALGSKTYLEPAAEFFVTPRWSMEIATGGRSTEFASGGELLPAGFALHPLTWTAKYNFALAQRLHPYLGFGWQYTRTSTDWSSGTGWAAQAGLDMQLQWGWVLNADIRYLGSLNSCASGPGSPCSAGHLNTGDVYLLSLGIAYRFASFR